MDNYMEHMELAYPFHPEPIKLTSNTNEMLRHYAGNRKIRSLVHLYISFSKCLRVSLLPDVSFICI